MSRIRKTVYRFSWPDVITLAASALLGLLLIIRPGTVLNTLLDIVAYLLIGFGIVRIAHYVLSSKNTGMGRMDLSSGITFAFLGLLVFVLRRFLISIVPLLFGIALIIMGFLKLQVSLDLRRMNRSNWNIVGIECIASIVMGVIIVLNPFATSLALMRFLGIFLMIETGQDAYALYSYSLAKR